ncbi:hypothetical protein [Lysobacter sp. CA199]|uniref:hypothetical protein n=1 Tax=Lysobacter sp. CA199 TaxID=3455608 RepID=UPI003F8D13FB
MSTNRSNPTLFRLFGAPVRVHWSVLLIVLLGLLFSRDPLVLLSALAAYIALIFAHEAGHAWVAVRNGLHVYELQIFPMHGWCLYQGGGTRGQEIAVAWGGVAAQALLFALAVALSKLSPGTGGPLSPILATVVLVWGPLNLLNAMVNLLPISPFDGRTAWRVFPWMAQRIRDKLRARPAPPSPKPASPRKTGDDKIVSLDERRKRR